MTLKHFQGKSLTQKPLLFSPAPSFRLGQASGIPRRSGFSLLLPHLCPYCCLHLEGHPSCLHSLSLSISNRAQSLTSIPVHPASSNGTNPRQNKSSGSLKVYPDLSSGKYQASVATWLTLICMSLLVQIMICLLSLSLTL